MDVEALVHSLVALVVGIIAIFMLISLWQHFYCDSEQKRKKYYSAIQISSIICLLGYIIRLLTLFMLHIPIYCPECNISHHTAVAWQLISAFFLFLTKPIIQIHYIIRLYYSFKGSAFSSKKSTFIMLFSIITVDILCILFYFISGLIQLNGDANNPLLVEDDFDDGDYGKPFESTYTIILLCVAVLCDLIVCYAITHLFVSKLFRLLIINVSNRHDNRPKELINVSQSKLCVHSVHSEDSDIDELSPTSVMSSDMPRSSVWKYSPSQKSMMLISKPKLKEKDTKMITTITRYTLLSCITMIFTQFYFLMQLIHIIWIAGYGQIGSSSYHSLDGPLAALSIIDSVLAISSVYLNFVFSRKWYDRFCGICHKGLQNICKRLTEKKVMKKQERDIQDEYRLLGDKVNK